MIKACLFDYGGVMTRSGGGGNELPDRLAENLDVSPERALALLLPVWTPYMKGEITSKQLWATIERQYGAPITKKQRNIWNTWQEMCPLTEMVELISELKTNGYKVGLISNVIPDTMTEIRSHGGYDLFDFTVLSYEIGHAKPEPEMYAAAIAKLPGIRPQEMVFLDDQKRCLAPARLIGMKTVWVKDAEKTPSVLRRILTP